MRNLTIYQFPGNHSAMISEVGGKGLSLMRGSETGLPVPQGCILSVAFFSPWFEELKTTTAWSHFQSVGKDDLAEACIALKHEAMKLSFTEQQQKGLSEAISKYGRNALFAVRSSSPEEDLEGSSFAGGYETILGVTTSNLVDAIRRAFASCLDYRVVIYKQKNGFDAIDPKIAIIIQEQIASDVAGVGFSLNPVTNNFDEAVFNANWGLGETVVAGIVTPDMYVVDKVGMKITEKVLGKKENSIWLKPTGSTEEKQNHHGNSFTLSESQILELTALIKKVEALYKKPIDIEWAYANSALYLLQARPITAYVPISQTMITQPGEQKRLYMDMTISAQGIERPMSVVGTSFFDSVVRIMGRAIFLRKIERRIDRTIPWFENGRLFITLSTILQFVDKRKVAGFLQMMDPLLASTISMLDEKDYAPHAHKIPMLPLGLLLRSPRIILHIFKAKWWPDHTHRKSNGKLALFKLKINAIAARETSYRELANKLVSTLFTRIMLETAPLFVLGKVSLSKMKKIAGKENEAAFASFDAGLPNNPTTEMGLALYRVSKLLPGGTALELEEGLKKGTLSQEFVAAWKNFIDIYGQRGPQEIDIAATRYHDSSALLLNILLPMRSMSEEDSPIAKFKQKQKERQVVYVELLEKIRAKSRWQARRFASYYKVFETFSGYREAHKYYLALVTDLLQEKILHEAKGLYAAGRLQSVEQVFDLTLEEIDRARTDISLDLIAQAKSNKIFINRLNNVPRLPTIFNSRGLIMRPPKSPVRAGEVVATAISPGIVRGRIKVLHTPNEKILEKGEILVARATDPGWTPLFINAGGVILEVGGLLQHGALVAREYGLPCVAGVENATTLWKDGTLVEVDGSAGIIRLVKETT